MKHHSIEALSASEFERLRCHASQEKDFIFLGSTADHGNSGRYQHFSACAHHQITFDHATCRQQFGRAPAGPVSQELTEAAAPFVVEESAAEHPLPGGWFGFVSYEFGYLREPRLQALCPPMPSPVFCAGLFLWVATYDRHTGEYLLFLHKDCAPQTRQQLAVWRQESGTERPLSWYMTRAFQPEQDREVFLAGIRRVKDYIEAGDCYQANLAQQFQGTYDGDPWAAFLALSKTHSTPFSAFMRFNGQALLSISPERFLKINRGHVETSPIKGTRRRGDTPDEDAALASELQRSEKDRAENLMIVDLLRNDLSINCQPGSVKVGRLFELETYQNVHHLVSHVQGELTPGTDPFKAFLEAFPGGSITGAPKIRAMEIIRELEPHWRGPYCGSVFYWGLNGRIDSNIAIRTLYCENGKIRCWGGGGIVADSDPVSEYEETLTKVRPLMELLEILQ
ncbi:MAG: aminodeoxychorismate synthase component I [Marinobacter sp.]|uniref:aminodeoxychorismate synthase component I n=1 Tax=Marinobacter sp. TaxID=50741 RepID=UPI0034A07152